MDKVFEEQAFDICNRFRDRGYNDHVVSNTLDKVKNTDKNDLLALKPPSKRDSKIVVASMFSPLSNKNKRCVIKHWHILSSGPLVGHSFKDMPIFANKHTKNLRDSLVRADH